MFDKSSCEVSSTVLLSVFSARGRMLSKGWMYAKSEKVSKEVSRNDTMSGVHGCVDLNTCFKKMKAKYLSPRGHAYERLDMTPWSAYGCNVLIFIRTPDFK